MNAYKDWSCYYSTVFIVFFGKQLLKIVGDLKSIIVKRDFHMSSENPIGNKIVYRPNNNDFAKILILLHNSANLSKEFAEAKYLIYLVKLLIICLTLMLLQFSKHTCAILALSFVCGS